MLLLPYFILFPKMEIGLFKLKEEWKTSSKENWTPWDWKPADRDQNEEKKNILKGKSG